MQYEDFIERVQERANIDSRDEAMKLVEAVLETLGERLSSAESENLAAQLPKQLQEHVLRREGTQRFDLTEFYTRVSARADIRHAPAMRQTQAVMAVLKEAVSPGEIEDILAELPSEFKGLFAG